MDYNLLTNEELVLLLKNRDEEIDKLIDENDSLERELDDLEDEFDDYKDNVEQPDFKAELQSILKKAEDWDYGLKTYLTLETKQDLINAIRKEVLGVSKYNFEFKENDYKTPSELYQKALYKLCIDKFSLDTCCSDEHIPASQYCINGIKDGLKISWLDNSWCNPPFNECKKWIEKAYNENIEYNINIAMLIPVRTETAYWHKFILNNPRVEIEFLRKGYKFLNSDNEEMGVFKNALALVYFKRIEV